jgi:hypothetical protein
MDTGSFSFSFRAAPSPTAMISIYFLPFYAAYEYKLLMIIVVFIVPIIVSGLDIHANIFAIQIRFKGVCPQIHQDCHLGSLEHLYWWQLFTSVILTMMSMCRAFNEHGLQEKAVLSFISYKQAAACAYRLPYPGSGMQLKQPVRAYLPCVTDRVLPVRYVGR